MRVASWSAGDVDKLILTLKKLELNLLHNKSVSKIIINELLITKLK